MPKKLGLHEVIQQFRDTHGDKYDYSQVCYEGSHKKIKIICPFHGEFEQMPSQHKIYGCGKCGGTKKLTQADVISKFKDVHGNRYDYSSVVYSLSKSPVEIICEEHGPFQQRPADHLKGKGCPRCGKRYKRTTSEIIDEFQRVHRHTYDYSKTEYIADKIKVTIICPTHGPFEQLPKTHKKGVGCPKCYVDLKSDYKTLSTSDILKKFTKTHGDKYDYSLVVYVNSDEPVKIGCKIHGIFLQKPAFHKSGSGCPLCAYESSSCKRSLDIGEVIARFKQIHSDRYDYSKVVYKSKDVKIEIICKEHGSFFQTPHNHLHGQQCPACKSMVQNVIYVWEVLDYDGIERLVKFGITSDHKGFNRITSVARTWDFDYKILIYAIMPDRKTTLEAEKILHAIFDNKPVFMGKLDGYSEFRVVSDNDINEVISYIESIKLR